jgi:3-oxoacyl-[acyl-carrier protein] reductase
MDKLNDKVAIVTGGTGALGRSVVSALAEEGARVICTYVNEKEKSECLTLTKNHKEMIHYIRADVTKENQVSRLIKECMDKFKRIDILVNIVGDLSVPAQLTPMKKPGTR